MLNINFACATLGVLMLAPGSLRRLPAWWAGIFIAGIVLQIGLGYCGVMEPFPETPIPYLLTRLLMLLP